jgi:hypothetical protein
VNAITVIASTMNAPEMTRRTMNMSISAPGGSGGPGPPGPAPEEGPGGPDGRCQDFGTKL